MCQNFCMKKQMFLELCEPHALTIQHQDTHSREPIPVQKQVATTIWKLATPDCYRSMANQFVVGKSTGAVEVVEVWEEIRTVVYPKVMGINSAAEIIVNHRSKFMDASVG